MSNNEAYIKRKVKKIGVGISWSKLEQNNRDMEEVSKTWKEFRLVRLGQM